MKEESKAGQPAWRRSEAARLGLLGALVGACAPVLFFLLHFALFHADFSLNAYARELFYGPAEDLLAFVFICGAVAVLGLSGFAVGRHRDTDRRLREKVESSNQELKAMNSIAEIIARTKDLDLMLSLVLKETLSLSFLSIECKGAIFIREDKDPGTLRMAANVDIDPFLVGAEKRIKMGHCLCGKAAATGEMVVSRDCFEDKDHTASYPGMASHGHVVVPISGKDCVFGVMSFYLPSGSAPSAKDVRVLSSIASQLSMAMENFDLLKDLTGAKEDVFKKSAELFKNVEVLDALVEVDRIILSTIDRDEMLFKVGSQIRQLVRADVGGVALHDEASGNCLYVGGWGLELRRGEVLIPTKMHAKTVLDEGRPMLRADLEKENPPFPIDALLAEYGMKSGVYAPISRKGRPVGLFFLGSAKAGGMDAEDMETSATFASRMGIALEHATLIGTLEDMSMNIVHVLATAIDAKSPWTKGHSERVAYYAVNIAERMGIVGYVKDRLMLAGLLHDIGKIGTYDVILDKAEKLTEQDMELIRQHPDRGCEILSPINEFKDILPAVRHHHERWDGRGYPSGLKAFEIPLSARILCVADSFDTMTADRPYRPSIGLDNAIQELKYCSGSQFDPEVAKVFLEIINEKGPALLKARLRAGDIFNHYQNHSSPSTAI